MKNGPAIQINRISKRYRQQVVLDAVSLQTRGPECVAIVGINGAGKTTLLRCLLDFTAPDDGDIYIDGRSSRDPLSRAGIAYLPERFVPPAHLTGIECLRLISELGQQRLDEVRAQDLLNELEFPLPALRSPTRNYSKGMAQKLGLVAAGLSAKPWLILDEPMSGLDPQSRRSVVESIRRARRQGQGVLFTTHVLQDLPDLCDRLLLIHQGAAIFDGTPAELIERHSAATLEQAFLSEIARHSPRRVS